MFVIEMNSVKCVEGKTAHFACRVEPAGDGSLKVDWFKDGKPVLTGKNWISLVNFYRSINQWYRLYKEG